MKPIIPIYAAESSIAHLIENNKTIGEARILIPDSVDLDHLREEALQHLSDSEIKASVTTTDDVMPLSSILVSSIWNKNDDLFTTEEIISAKDTPKFKPINWMHRGSETRGNENIGVMVDTTLMRGDIDSLEEYSEAADGELVHIRQDGLIWSRYFPSYAETIKEGIKNSNLFVSMECFYDNFDYALMNSRGDIKLLERTSDNAALSLELKCFGGDGTVVLGDQEVRIGRWLRGVNFSGQGIVNKPANTQNNKPLSVILSGDWSVQSNLNKNPDVVYYNTGNSPNTGDDIKMSDSKTLEQLEAELQKAVAERDEAVKKLASHNESQLTKNIEGLTAEIDGLKEENSKLETEKGELEAKLESTASLQEELDKLKTDYESVQKELNEIKALEVARERMKSLKAINESADELGYAEEDFINMSEEAFDVLKKSFEVLTKAGVSGESKLTDQTVSGQPKSTDQTVSGLTKLTEASEKTEDEEVVEASDSLEDAEQEEEADLLVASTSDQVDNTRIAKALLDKLGLR